MCTRNLKNFDKYLQKLELYAKAIKVKLVSRDLDGCGGSYAPWNRMLKVDHDIEGSSLIATILHELGHEMDDSLREDLDKKMYSKIMSCYVAVYSDKHTEEQLALVIECESRAWDYGKVIAKKLKIPLGKWYTNEAKECVAAYKDTKKEDEK